MTRGEAGSKSDVGLLIETDPAARLGYFELCDLRRELETQLRRPDNFAFGSEMRPSLREWIEDDRSGSSDAETDVGAPNAVPPPTGSVPVGMKARAGQDLAARLG